MNAPIEWIDGRSMGGREDTRAMETDETDARRIAKDRGRDAVVVRSGNATTTRIDE